jgi:hypothetical protein
MESISHSKSFLVFSFGCWLLFVSGAFTFRPRRTFQSMVGRGLPHFRWTTGRTLRKGMAGSFANRMGGVSTDLRLCIEYRPLHLSELASFRVPKMRQITECREPAAGKS